MTAWEAILEAPRRLSAAVESARPTLRGIPSPPRRMSAVPFAVVVVALLGLGMVGLLFLNTHLQNQAFVVRKAQTEASELGYRVSDLESQVTRAQSPARLAAEATELGMVPNPHGVYIDLGTGRVVGEATPVRGDEIPSLQVREVTAPTRPSATPTPADAAPDAAGQADAAAPPADGGADTGPTITPVQRAATVGGTP